MELYDKDGNQLSHQGVIEALTDKVIIDLIKCTRVEVIDSTGRAYTNYDAENVQISIQDNTRTLKVFLK